MQVKVYAVGRKMPAWVLEGCAEYQKRLPAYWKFSMREFAQVPQRGASAEHSMQQEGKSLLSALPEPSHVVALDNRGLDWSTEKLAGQLQRWRQQGLPVIFVIGGANGLHDQVRQRADQLWSLSPLTFPHPLVRVILTEQLYRAQSLLDNHPYHRA